MPTARKTLQHIDSFGRVVLRTFVCNDGSAQDGGAVITIYREPGKRQIWRSRVKKGACSFGDIRFSSIKKAILDIPTCYQEVR